MFRRNRGQYSYYSQKPIITFLLQYQTRYSILSNFGLSNQHFVNVNTIHSFRYRHYVYQPPQHPASSSTFPGREAHYKSPDTFLNTNIDKIASSCVLQLACSNAQSTVRASAVKLLNQIDV